MRINGAGQVLDPQGVAVSPTNRPSFSFSLASPRNGTTLFIWSATDNMPQQRSMAADGTLGAVGPFVTQNGAVVPGLASDGHGYLSAFNVGDSSDTGSVYGHLLDLDGNPGAEFRIDASTLNTGPFVLPAPSGYLVAYARSGTHLVSVSDTGALGQVLDLTSTAAVVNGASSQTDSLVAWSDNYGLPGPLQARFVKAGAFSGKSFELTPDSLGYAPAIAWDGTSYWAVWESSTHELDGRTIGEDGTLGSVFPLVPAEVYAPALLSDGNGQLLLSYAKLAGERRSYRIASRLIGRGASGSSGGGGSAGGGAGGSTGWHAVAAAAARPRPAPAARTAAPAPPARPARPRLGRNERAGLRRYERIRRGRLDRWRARDRRHDERWFRRHIRPRRLGRRGGRQLRHGWQQRRLVSGLLRRAEWPGRSFFRARRALRSRLGLRRASPARSLTHVTSSIATSPRGRARATAVSALLFFADPARPPGARSPTMPSSLPRRPRTPIAGRSPICRLAEWRRDDW